MAVGSGCGGLTAALTAAAQGLDTLIIEEASVYGGSTALSGGNVWIDAESACPEFARRAALGEHSIWIPTCSALRDSIEKAVESGELHTDCERHEPVPGRL